MVLSENRASLDPLIIIKILSLLKYDNLGAYPRQTHPMMDRSRRMSGHPSGVIKRGRWEIPDKWRLKNGKINGNHQ